MYSSCENCFRLIKFNSSLQEKDCFHEAAEEEIPYLEKCEDPFVEATGVDISKDLELSQWHFLSDRICQLLCEECAAEFIEKIIEEVRVAEGEYREQFRFWQPHEENYEIEDLKPFEAELEILKKKMQELEADLLEAKEKETSVIEVLFRPKM